MLVRGDGAVFLSLTLVRGDGAVFLSLKVVIGDRGCIPVSEGG